jgi:hypothetical protein
MNGTGTGPKNGLLRTKYADLDASCRRRSERAGLPPPPG